MAMSTENRAARLVDTLERAGHKVKRLFVKYDEITIEFAGIDEVEPDDFAISHVDWTPRRRRVPKS